MVMLLLPMLLLMLPLPMLLLLLPMLLVFSDWPTIPQLYIKKEFVGGCDIVKEMYETGELAKLLETKGVSFKAKN